MTRWRGLRDQDDVAGLPHERTIPHTRKAGKEI